ncbi:hypothetical protein BX070DRAFT_224336 [Coemansia spiralis]|nr:hypothetical protein BX070DRAFT_224336 [Coemansia spiralis]
MMTLFVGHINERIKDQALCELFSPYGKISIIDRKGTYAFVEYDGPADTRRAVRDLNKKEIMGTVLRVELSNRVRGESGPPPGDLSEICYNCQQIGHIAKNCPYPLQTPNEQQLSQRKFQMQQYVSAPNSSAHNQQPYQRNRISKHEGFLDRNPHKVRLNKIVNPRMRLAPYLLTTGSDLPLKPQKKGNEWNSTQMSVEGEHRAAWSNRHVPPVISPRTLPQQIQRPQSPPDNPSLEMLYPTNIHSTLAPGITHIASSPLSHSAKPLETSANTSCKILPYDRYPSSAVSFSPISGRGSQPEQIHSPAHREGLQASYSSIGYPSISNSQFGHTQSVSAALSSYIHPSNAQVVENPYLPPGTLVYMPMITVLPGTQSQSQSQQYQQSSPPLRFLPPVQQQMATSIRPLLPPLPPSLQPLSVDTEGPPNSNEAASDMQSTGAYSKLVDNKQKFSSFELSLQRKDAVPSPAIQQNVDNIDTSDTKAFGDSESNNTKPSILKY